MGKRGGDWVPCQEYGTAVSIAGNAGVNIPLVMTVESIFGAVASTPVREVGTVETGSEAIVNRVVGQVDVTCSGAGTECVYIERIRTGMLDNQGAGIFFANSFANAEDANEPFLWQRISRLEVGAANILASFGHPYWSVVDVRVSRRLKDGMALFYSIEGRGAATVSLRVTPYLRSWARNV